MKIFDKFPKQVKCPICGTNKEGKSVLIIINGTINERIAEARCYHLDCIELTEYQKDNKMCIGQVFNKKNN